MTNLPPKPPYPVPEQPYQQQPPPPPPGYQAPQPQVYQRPAAQPVVPQQPGYPVQVPQQYGQAPQQYGQAPQQYGQPPQPPFYPNGMNSAGFRPVNPRAAQSWILIALGIGIPVLCLIGLVVLIIIVNIASSVR